MINIDELIQDAVSIQPLPAASVRLAGLLSDVDSSAREIIETVKLDPPLTARLLRVANSAAGASVRSIATVDEAVIRLGTGSVLAISVAGNVATRAAGKAPGYDLDEGAFWRHSVTAMLCAQAVSTVARKAVPAESATAALLHDFGKLVLGRFLDPNVRAVLSRAKETLLDEVSAEREVLEVHHGEVGALIAQKWGLPETLVWGIQYHHFPHETSHLINQVVAFANACAHRIEDRTWGAYETIAVTTSQHLNISETQRDSICIAVEASRETVLGSFSGSPTRN